MQCNRYSTLDSTFAAEISRFSVTQDALHTCNLLQHPETQIKFRTLLVHPLPLRPLVRVVCRSAVIVVCALGRYPVVR